MKKPILPLISGLALLTLTLTLTLMAHAQQGPRTDVDTNPAHVHNLRVAPGTTIVGHPAGVGHTATVTLSPPSGTYTAAQTVTIADATAGAVIYYTLDGTQPTTSSPIYSAPVAVSQTAILGAFAVAPGFTASGTTAASYLINNVGNHAIDSVGGGTVTPDGRPLSPINIRVTGGWDATARRPFDVLTCDPVTGATGYNWYQYGTLIGTTTSPTFTLPVHKFNGAMTYTATAISPMGGMTMESLPSAPCGAQGEFDPSVYNLTTRKDGFLYSTAPVPGPVVVTPQWNAGAPRTLVTWSGQSNDIFYNVYRDGTLVAQGLFVLYYQDQAVTPGVAHTYTVTGVGYHTVDGSHESAPSAPASGAPLSATPAALTTPVVITSVVPNDDSVKLFWNAVPGAADYRVYQQGHQGSMKYSCGCTSIEMNGLPPTGSISLIVEAVDKPGPFQTMDGVLGPGAMDMSGDEFTQTNGSGDPSNVPNVIATSAPVVVSCVPAPPLPGSQVFFDNFRAETPLVQVPNPAGSHPVTNDSYDERTFQNALWTDQLFGCDMAMTRIFFMGEHVMDTNYDGPTAATHSFSHNNNATVVMTPRQSFDFSGGKVLHVTMEVDPCVDGRRWLGIYLTPAGDVFYNPGKFFEGNTVPTRSGKIFRWKIDDIENCDFFDGSSTTLANEQTVVVDGLNYNMVVGGKKVYSTQRGTDHGQGAFPYNHMNDYPQGLDFRHKFDLYISSTHLRLMEAGVVVCDTDLPAGKSLPFTSADVHFIHQVYHTGNDRPGNVAIGPAKQYYYNYRPYADERHWNSLGADVESGFPALP